MTRLLPLQGLILNLRGEVSPRLTKVYLPKETAYQLLKTWTGKDFGWDIEAWENWVSKHPHLTRQDD